MIKYKANVNGIEKIEIRGETTKLVTLLSGIREAKISEYNCYFDTWEEARAHLIEKVEKDIRKYRTRLEMALAYKDKLEAMQKP